MVFFHPKRLRHVFHRIVVRVFLKVDQFHIVIKRQLNLGLLFLPGFFNEVFHCLFHLLLRIIRIALP